MRISSIPPYCPTENPPSPRPVSTEFLYPSPYCDVQSEREDGASARTPADRVRQSIVDAPIHVNGRNVVQCLHDGTGTEALAARSARNPGKGRRTAHLRGD